MQLYGNILAGVIIVDFCLETVALVAEYAGRHGIPVAAAYEYRKSSTGKTPDFDLVNDDYSPGCERAVAQWFENGIREIAFAGFDSLQCRAHSRTRGYLAAMEKAGRPPLMIIEKSEAALPRTDIQFLDIGRRVAERMARRKSLPGAVMCINDIVAAGVYEGLASLGVRCPGEVELIGGGDDADVHSYFRPDPSPISTIAISRREKAAVLTGLLLSRLGDPSLPPRFRTIYP